MLFSCHRLELPKLKRIVVGSTAFQCCRQLAFEGDAFSVRSIRRLTGAGVHSTRSERIPFLLGEHQYFAANDPFAFGME